MNTYPSYKDSGVEWIGDIPSDWDIVRMCYVFKTKSIKNTHNETNLSVYRDYGVIPTNSRDDNHNVISEDISNYKLVDIGDFVMNKMKCWMGSLGLSDYRGIVSPSYTVMEPLIENEHKYIHYLLRSKLYIPQYKRLSYGVRIGQWDLRFEDFRELPCLIPPLHEQQQISDYLDYKTSKIDTLIEKTQQKIELLKEQRISLINTTVTKGLDPNVEMKDSGVEWIGDIPSDWKVKKLTYVTNSIGSGTTPKTSNSLFYEEGHIPWLNTGDLNDGYIYKTKKKVTKLAIEKHTSLKVFPINSVSIAMYGATIGKLGLFKIPVTVNQANCVFVFDEVNVSKFWFYVLMEYRPQIVSLGYGGGQPNISQDLLKSLRFGCPSYKNQQQIVDYLDKETSKIDKLVDIESKRIVLLKEYRQSLISEVVTGKVDVRDEVLL